MSCGDNALIAAFIFISLGGHRWVASKIVGRKTRKHKGLPQQNLSQR